MTRFKNRQFAFGTIDMRDDEYESWRRTAQGLVGGSGIQTRGIGANPTPVAKGNRGQPKAPRGPRLEILSIEHHF